MEIIIGKPTQKVVEVSHMSRKSDQDESISPDVPDFEPADRPFSTQEKRRRFMEVVVELEPMVLEKLRAMYDQLTTAGIEWRYPAFPPALEEWGDNWWLKDFWCFDWARESFREWAKLPAQWDTESMESLRRRWHRAGGTIPGDVPEGASFQLQPIRAWSVLRESERVFRKRARRQFYDELNSYIEIRRVAAKAARAVPPAIKRQDVHFFWLARYQVKGETVASVAENNAAGLTFAAIFNAINRTAAELGLTIRPRSLD